MTKQLKSGDKISWNSHGGTANGKVVRKVTSPMKMKGHKAAASKDNPEYLVETDDGKRAGAQGRGPDEALIIPLPKQVCLCQLGRRHGGSE